MSDAPYAVISIPANGTATERAPIKFYNGSAWVDQKTAAKAYSHDEAREIRKQIAPLQDHLNTFHPLQSIDDVSGWAVRFFKCGSHVYTIRPGR
jgi:hypothetical protein